jgi:peptidoglycan/LPS O-acetylase OafA/YrhL
MTTNLASGAAANPVETPSGLAVPERNSFGGRFEFLDAIRGIAAFLVVVEHIFEQYFPAFGEWSLTHFRFGEFGVTVFFLVSGYIIPASLERRGSLKEFWIGRFFRLFPLYWACIAAMLILHKLDLYRGFSGAYLDSWVGFTAVNLTMLQNFTSTPLAMGQSWTLAYEMVFYIVVCVLFAAGWHKRSAVFATIGLTVSLLVGNRLAPSPLGEMSTNRWLLLIAMVAVAMAVGAVLTRHRGIRIALLCAVLLGLVALGLFNRPEPTFTAAFFLGTMFFGNCVYRWTTGLLSSRALLLLTMLAFVAIVVAQEHDWSPWLAPVPEINGAFHLAEVLTYGGAYVTFFAAFLFREKRYPGVLLWLGRISYSLYLVHSVVLYTVPEIPGQPLATALITVAATVVVSWLTYRFIEQPAIDLGRAVTQRMRGRAQPTTPEQAGLTSPGS